MKKIIFLLFAVFLMAKDIQISQVKLNKVLEKVVNNIKQNKQINRITTLKNVFYDKKSHTLVVSKEINDLSPIFAKDYPKITPKQKIALIKFRGYFDERTLCEDKFYYGLMKNKIIMKTIIYIKSQKKPIFDDTITKKGCDNLKYFTKGFVYHEQIKQFLR